MQFDRWIIIIVRFGGGGRTTHTHSNICSKIKKGTTITTASRNIVVHLTSKYTHFEIFTCVWRPSFGQPRALHERHYLLLLQASLLCIAYVYAFLIENIRVTMLHTMICSDAVCTAKSTSIYTHTLTRNKQTNWSDMCWTQSTDKTCPIYKIGLSVLAQTMCGICFCLTRVRMFLQYFWNKISIYIVPEEKLCIASRM